MQVTPNRIIVDDREPNQLNTHNHIVAATDSFLSGWGQAGQSPSYCGWACPADWVKPVTEWVESRKEMKRVRVVDGAWKPKRGHTHIYVVTRDHPAMASYVRRGMA